MRRISKVRKKYLLVFTLSILPGGAALAQKSEIEDTKLFAEKIDSYFGGRERAIVDNVALKIDRSDPHAEFLNSSGILSTEEFGKTITRHSSATLISPCHVLSTAVDFEDALGKELYFSLGQGAKPGRSFRYLNFSGQIAETGAGTSEEKNRNMDWAIVRLNREVPNEIRPSPLGDWHMAPETVTVMAGYPGEDVSNDPDLFLFFRAEFVSIEKIDSNGIWTTSKKQAAVGSRGSSLLVIEQKNREYNSYVGALFIGSEPVSGRTLAISSKMILRKLRQKNPALFFEIMEATSTGRCPKPVKNPKSFPSP
jgi:hypothetical protein